MEAAGTFFILFGIGVLILQVVMIVKFFQIAANVKALKESQIIGNSVTEFQQRIELEKYLGNTDKVRDILIREYIKSENEYRYRSNYGVNTEAVEKVLEYLNEELTKIGVNPDELTEKICGKR